MYTQRRVERRSAGRNASFPLVINGGKILAADRRCNPDRRLGNIVQELKVLNGVGDIFL
jgi:hypothetical protein